MLPHPTEAPFSGLPPLLLSRLLPTPPAPGEGLRLALWQGEGTAGTPEAVEANLLRLEQVAAEAASWGTQLLAFPELFLSGYASEPQRVRQLAEPVDGPSLERVAACARRHGLAIACPYAERALLGGQERFYDAIALVDADGTLLKNYRKTHLWGPDERLFWSEGYRLAEEGEPFTVHPVNGLGVGLLNCYEAEFPELTRLLTLAGASLVLIPTAADTWVRLSDGRRTAHPYPDVSRSLLPAHAFANGCFVAYANRCGLELVEGEAWAHYLGNSVICGPDGALLLAAQNRPTLLLADLIPAEFRAPHPEGTTYRADRRPDLYGSLQAPAG